MGGGKIMVGRMATSNRVSIKEVIDLAFKDHINKPNTPEELQSLQDDINRKLRMATGMPISVTLIKSGPNSVEVDDIYVEWEA